MVYNFGSPKVGDDEFVRRFNRLVPNSFRVVNDADVIVRLPRNKGVGAVPGAAAPPLRGACLCRPPAASARHVRLSASASVSVGMRCWHACARGDADCGGGGGAVVPKWQARATTTTSAAPFSRRRSALSGWRANPPAPTL